MRVQKALTLLTNDPGRFAGAVKARLTGGGKAPRQKFTSYSISRGLRDQIAALDGLRARTIAAYGDRPFFEAVTQELADADLSVDETQWVSNGFDDQQNGAIRPDQLDWTVCDAVMVGGPGLAEAYRHCIELMAGAGVVKPVLWVGEGFEYCMGSLPVPAEAENAEIFLYQHFKHYFGVKEPLLARLEVHDSQTSRIDWRILQPDRTLRLALSDLLPDRTGPAVFLIHTEHPQLTRGRHNRWRVTADVYWRGSITTLHGAHDVRGPAASSRFRLNTALMGSGKLVVTLPNYEPNCPPESDMLAISTPAGLDVTAPSASQRGLGRPIDQLCFDVHSNDSAPVDNDPAKNLVLCEYQGSGGSFWYGLETNDTTAGGGSIIANHSIGPPKKLTGEFGISTMKRQRLENLYTAGYRLHPHPVPITAREEPLVFGFCFDLGYPHVPRYILDFHDGDGERIATRGYDAPASGVVNSDQVLASIGGEDDAELAQHARLLVVSPDWLGCNIDPTEGVFYGDFTVQNRVSGDHDFTEFQNSWRNLGSQIPEFPHWIHPARSVFSTTNVIGRVVRRDGVRSGILIINASGYQGYRTTANTQISILSSDGKAMVVECAIPAFTSRTLWLDELLPNLAQHLSEGFGTMLVQSRDADMNCHMVTCTHQGAVSLQHMWGY